MIKFHGGCDGCRVQIKKGIDNCVNCQYFDSDWTLPNLNGSHYDKAFRERMTIKQRNNIPLKEEEDYYLENSHSF
jgi:hypothetical protein